MLAIDVNYRWVDLTDLTTPESLSAETLTSRPRACTGPTGDMWDRANHKCDNRAPKLWDT